MKRNFFILTPNGSVESSGENALAALKAARPVHSRSQNISGIIDARCVAEPHAIGNTPFEILAGFRVAQGEQS
ncbi:MAG: hypothetical protein ACR2HH_01850 [Chthoniobacterales bacterium]